MVAYGKLLFSAAVLTAGAAAYAQSSGTSTGSASDSNASSQTAEPNLADEVQSQARQIEAGQSRARLDREQQEQAARPGVAQRAPMHRVSDIIGTTIRNQEGQELGTIQDLIVDGENRQIQYFVLSTGEAVAAEDDKLQVIPWEALSASPDPNDRAFVMAFDQQRLQQAPRFGWNQLQQGDRWATDVNRFYGVTSRTTGFRGTGTPGAAGAVGGTGVQAQGAAGVVGGAAGAVRGTRGLGAGVGRVRPGAGAGGVQRDTPRLQGNTTGTGRDATRGGTGAGSIGATGAGGRNTGNTGTGGTGTNQPQPGATGTGGTNTGGTSTGGTSTGGTSTGGTGTGGTTGGTSGTGGTTGGTSGTGGTGTGGTGTGGTGTGGTSTGGTGTGGT